MGKFLITEWNRCILTAFYDGTRILTLDLAPQNDAQILGNIYVARIERVVKNLNAAFLRYGEQKRAYCALDHPSVPIFQNRNVNFSENMAEVKLREGDIVLAQITQEAIKTKEPCMQTDLSLAGRYVVLEMNAPKFLNFSKKIRDREFRRSWEKIFATPDRPDSIREEPSSSSDKENLSSEDLSAADNFCSDQYPLGKKFHCDMPYGFILRTNALHAPKEDVLKEMVYLESIFRNLLEQGRCRSLYSLVYQNLPGYLREVRDAYGQDVEEVVTDLPHLYEQMKEAFAIYPDLAAKLRLYRDDQLALSKLYPVEKAMREALAKKVWLKSGGYLLIEQTEACVVIDVNTGKFDAKKEKEATFLKINLEAAEEIALQLRLRNLSGMILIDFINMSVPENDDTLMQHLKAAVARDPLPVAVVDMTKLGLVEMTRKKEKMPIAQRYAELADTNLIR